MMLPNRTFSEVRNGYRLSMLCRHSYTGDISSLGFFTDLEADKFVPFFLEDKGVPIQGFAAVGKTSRVIVFRGTDELSDWWFNLKSAQLKWGKRGGKVHAGFLDAFAKSDEAESALRRLGNENLPLYVAGHSLGGALAMLFADAEENAGRPVHRVHTFGCPRVYNLRAAREYPCVVQRWVTLWDAVPRAPFRGYWHTGRMNLLTKHGMGGFWATAARYTCGLLYPRSGVTNHSMEAYVSRLYAAVEIEDREDREIIEPPTKPQVAEDVTKSGVIAAVEVAKEIAREVAKQEPLDAE